MISLLLILSLIQTVPLVSAQSAQDQLQTVCQIVEHPGRFDGKTVTVEAIIAAGFHSTVLQGDPCGRGIYMIHDAGHTSDKWADFDRALARKSTGLDKRPLLVKVRGIYRASVPFGSKKIRQLEVTEVLQITVRPN
jgi:hypothetical protein